MNLSKPTQCPQAVFQDGSAKLKLTQVISEQTSKSFLKLLKEFFWHSLPTQKQLKRFYSGIFFLLLKKKSALGQNLNMKGFSWKKEILSSK